MKGSREDIRFFGLLEFKISVKISRIITDLYSNFDRYLLKSLPEKQLLKLKFNWSRKLV